MTSSRPSARAVWDRSIAPGTHGSGMTVGGQQVIVLEFVEGETLADRIARGPVPVDDALALARQIAEALDAAHEKGIVHRDLKPANIAVSREGVVKVLVSRRTRAVRPQWLENDGRQGQAGRREHPGRVNDTALRRRLRAGVPTRIRYRAGRPVPDDRRRCAGLFPVDVLVRNWDREIKALARSR